MTKVIDKSAVVEFLDELIGAGQVFAPVLEETQAGKDEMVCLELVESAEEIPLAVQALVRKVNTRQAPKEIFFPRSEVLFSYREGQVIPVEFSEARRVVFAIRPCDARSAVLLDNVFDGDEASGKASVQDPYYVKGNQAT